MNPRIYLKLFEPSIRSTQLLAGDDDSDDEAGTAASNAQETPSVANDDDDEADGDSEHAVSASKGKHKKKKKKNKAKTNSAVDSANTADVPADQRRQGSSLQL